LSLLPDVLSKNIFFFLFFAYFIEYYEDGYTADYMNNFYDTADCVNSFDEPVTFPCPRNCGRHYKYKKGVSFHLKYECGVPRKFKCEICGKEFSQNSNCKKHKLLMHNVIQY